MGHKVHQERLDAQELEECVEQKVRLIFELFRHFVFKFSIGSPGMPGRDGVPGLPGIQGNLKL